MGLTISCPSGENNSADEGFGALLGSINFGGKYAKSGLCNGDHNSCDSEPNLMKAFGSGKYIIEGSVDFERKESNPFRLETKFSFKSFNGDSEICAKSNEALRARFSEEVVDPVSPKHDAAIKLQKFYKSFRTRRQLADCAVLIEQKWWKLLDFALLKRSSVSFFDIDKPESAVSKWSRARTRAAKVGKGLSKNSKARKLALQHWLEAIDPRHRYGHNLHFYYACWLRCEGKQPFFYWLDVGDGKEVNLEACSRTKLQQQCIKYLGPKEREAYEVIVEKGRFIYKKSREIVDTTGGLKDSKWIFVLSASKALYVGLKRKGLFQHSSFLAGGATSAAGRLVVVNGFLKSVWPHSGHYRPTEENFEDFMSFLEENYVALDDVKKSPEENDGEWVGEHRSCISRSDSSMPNSYSDSQMGLELQLPNSGHESDSEGEVLKDSSATCEKDDQTSEGEEEKESESTTEANQAFEAAESSCSFNTEPPSLFMEDKEDGGKESVPEELIIERISSKKVLKSCHMGTKLQFNWSTGAGARIGYVRNYPSELQFQALEQVNLSPRAVRMSRPFSSPQNTAPSHWQKTQGCTLKESVLQRLH